MKRIEVIMSLREDLLVWVDLETTGFDFQDQMKGCQDHLILEIGVLVTDSSFNIVGDELSIIINQNEADYNLLSDDVVKKMHKDSGLYEAMLKSSIDLKTAEELVIQYLKDLNIKPKSSPICGNNVSFDKNFIDAQMPLFSSFLHYRKIDVSSFKEVYKRILPEFAGTIIKKAKHRAIDDIKESVEELKLYLTKIKG